ncbi:MAG TPA: S-layer homology domain-containing protein, partial [Chloroflexota bacterium]|nr:S-layer homology domain-containing protein [Chloroflexota bacterium]
MRLRAARWGRAVEKMGGVCIVPLLKPRNLVALVMAWLLVVGVASPGLAAGAAAEPELTAAAFCDVSPADPWYEAVTQLSARGIIRGYANGCFGPNDTTLR